jgi:hypothetical protein
MQLTRLCTYLGTWAGGVGKVGLAVATMASGAGPTVPVDQVVACEY